MREEKIKFEQAGANREQHQMETSMENERSQQKQATNSKLDPLALKCCENLRSLQSFVGIIKLPEPSIFGITVSPSCWSKLSHDLQVRCTWSNIESLPVGTIQSSTACRPSNHQWLDSKTWPSYCVHLCQPESAVQQHDPR